MRKAGLLDRLLASSRPEGQATRVLDKDGRIHVDLKPEDDRSTKPEIDRGVLRRLLLDSLAPGTVRWGSRLKQVDRGADGHPRLTFADGAVQEADLLFGCDGAWSRVRPLVSSERPHYTGVTFVESRVSNADAAHPGVAELVGPGTIMATGDDRAIIAQRNGSGHVRVYATLRVPEGWSRNCGIDFGNPADAREALLRFYDGWAPEVVELIKGTDDYFVPRPLYTLSPEQTWDVQPDVTLLGDAAHVMPPFTGKGANLAMLDAVELADALLRGPTGLLCRETRSASG